jgi:hypothetical protein
MSTYQIERCEEPTASFTFRMGLKTEKDILRHFKKGTFIEDARGQRFKIIGLETEMDDQKFTIKINCERA